MSFTRSARIAGSISPASTRDPTETSGSFPFSLIMESFGQRLGHGKWAVTWADARVGGGLLRIESVLPICGIDRGEEAREPDVLLPGDLGTGGRQTTDRPAAVPGHQRGSDGPPVRRPGRDARTGAAQGVRE